MPALIVLAIITIITPFMASYEFMKYVFSIFIIFGLSLDLIDFIFIVSKCLKREKTPSATPILGFLLVAIGLVGFAIRSTVTWKTFFLLLSMALATHLTFQIVFPLIFSMICNIYYKRKLFDFSQLPEKKG